MAKIAIYEGFGRRKGRKSKTTPHKRARRAHKGHASRANTPQARKFKAALTHCRAQKAEGSTVAAVQKQLGACVRKFYRKR